jgi:hypothetical protein
MVHVYPLDDVKEHDISNTGNTCHCNPQVIIEPNSDIIVVHNSFDGREGLEWADDILNPKNK